MYPNKVSGVREKSHQEGMFAYSLENEEVIPMCMCVGKEVEENGIWSRGQSKLRGTEEWVILGASSSMWLKDTWAWVGKRLDQG